MGLPFDRITWMLETLLTPEIRQRVYDERAAVVERWQEQCAGTSREKTNELLLAAARECEADLASVCARHSADLWLSLVRRMPPSVFPVAWSTHATLAILKYSSWSQDTTAGSVHEDGTFGVALVYTSEDMKDAWRIAVDAALIARLLQWRRVCSKGGGSSPAPVSTCRRTSATRSTNTSAAGRRKPIPATRPYRCLWPATWSARSFAWPRCRCRCRCTFRRPTSR